ncbi:hypothetical protein Tco_1139603 [Tanacetum coccineum]
MVLHVNWLQCFLQAKIKEYDKSEVQFSLRSSSMSLIYLNTPALFFQLVDEHTAEDDIEVFSIEPSLDWISAYNFLTLPFSLTPSQTDTPETDKNECTSLLKDLLSHLGYSMGGIISSASSHLGSITVLWNSAKNPEVHTLSLSTKSKP